MEINSAGIAWIGFAAWLRLEKMRTSPDVTMMIRLIVLFVAALIRMSPGGGSIA